MRIRHLRHLTLKLTAIFALGAIISACGGGRGTALDNLNNGGGGGSGGGGTGNEVAQIGTGTGANFQAGVIGVGIGDNTLSAGGSTLLSVTVVNNGQLITDSVSVSFNSPCFASGTALLSPQTGVSDDSNDASNVVQTTNGQATIRYTANGCSGPDLVRASTTYGGSVISADAVVEVAADTVTSLAFVDASPNYITLKGTGGTEASTVRFRVRGSTGAPVNGVNVSFSLSSTAGGLALVNSSDTSGVDGYVYTTVQAGTVPGTIRITATTEEGISTQSRALAVSTGLPDQKGFGISATDLTPNSWNTDGVESIITIRVADAFSNPVPVGTAVSFATSGGVIQPACIIDGIEDNPDISSGSCSVTWTSQNPRPRDTGLLVSHTPPWLSCADPNVYDCRSGRFVIIATTLGNESFIDVNGNGRYDPGVDIFYTADSGNSSARRSNCEQNEPVSGSSSSSYGCDDLGTAYLDRNGNGQHDANETVYSVNDVPNPSYEQGNGIYNGLLCQPNDAAAGLCSREPVLVRADALMVMSCDEPLLLDGRLPGQPTSVRLAPGASATITMLIADCNGNGLPQGTTFSLNDGAALNLSDAALSTEGPLASNHEPGTLAVILKADDAEPVGGFISINISVPGAGESSAEKITSVFIALQAGM